MALKETDHLIWSDYYLDFEDWREFLEEEYPDYADHELVDIMYKTNDEYIDDERYNLDIPLNRTIIVIGDLGLWNGRRMGYKEIQSGNIKDCLYSDTDYSTWYVDKDGDLRCEAIHHDGTNYYRYRVYKRDVTDEQIEDLKEKLYCGRATEADILSVTDRLGDEIGKVYGWQFANETKKPMEVGAR